MIVNVYIPPPPAEYVLFIEEKRSGVNEYSFKDSFRYQFDNSFAGK